MMHVLLPVGVEASVAIPSNANKGVVNGQEVKLDKQYLELGTGTYDICLLYTSIICTQCRGGYFDEALGIFCRPAFLHFAVFAALVFHTVVLAFYTYGREAEWVQLEDSRTVYVALRGLQHGFEDVYKRQVFISVN